MCCYVGETKELTNLKPKVSHVVRIPQVVTNLFFPITSPKTVISPLSHRDKQRLKAYGLFSFCFKHKMRLKVAHAFMLTCKQND